MRRPAPTAADFGEAYYRGRVCSNYQNYQTRQGQKAAWLPTLWLFRWICRRYAGTPIAHLDVGCALGYFLAYARTSVVQHSVGVDLSPYAIARAKARFPALEFLEAPADALPLPDGAFHVLTSFDTLEHVPDVAAALREIRRVLRPDGTLMVRVPYAGWARRWFGWRDRDPTHVSVLSFRGWVEALAEGGFVREHVVWYPTPQGDQALFIARKRTKAAA